MEKQQINRNGQDVANSIENVQHISENPAGITHHDSSQGDDINIEPSYPSQPSYASPIVAVAESVIVAVDNDNTPSPSNIELFFHDDPGVPWAAFTRTQF